MSRVNNFPKCHGNVGKHTNPLQVDDLIKNKSLENFVGNGHTESYFLFLRVQKN